MREPTLTEVASGLACKKDPLPVPRRSVMVKYRLPSGEELQGVFTFRLPSAEDYRRIAVAQANLTQGVAWAAIAPDLQGVLVAMARCAVLVEEYPDWWKRPLTQLGADLFLSLSGEIARAESEFFRSGEAQQGFVEIEPLEG